LLAAVTLLALTPLASHAQGEYPQIPLRKKAVKDVGPRALGLLKLSSDGKATLAPIAIMIGDKFYDATVYKAAPVPMALEWGTVYEAERSGSSLGLFTVHSALRSNAVNATTPWLATGTWMPVGSEPTQTTRKAETVPVGIEVVDERPRLTRDPKRISLSSVPPAVPQGRSGTSGESKPPSKPDDSKAPEESRRDDSRPTLKRKPEPDAQPADSTSPGATSPPQAGSVPSEKPKPGDQTPQTTGSQGTSSQASSASSAGQPTQNPSNEGGGPRLRRGKPTEALPSDDDVPGYSKPGAGGTAKGTGGLLTVTSAARGPVQMIPAISDAGGPEPRSFTFTWSKDVETDRRQKMIELARQKLRAYIDAQSKRTIAPASKPAPAKPGARKAGSKPPEAVLGNSEMVTYDLWGNNEPVMILSAEGHMPPALTTSTSAPPASPHYSIVLVARTDIYGNLHSLYAGVTDQFHLDLTPRLELIDAVDADGDGRGELLFRETSDTGSGYVIYRATADTLWKLFDSLHPE
jgi:hypothetical protein